MIAAEELAAAPVFASVPRDDLARVARAAGDVRLVPGEYAIHEGDERALFVVLVGRIEVTKLIDGIERVIGVRAPGQIFGEVPITFGTPFQGQLPRDGAHARGEHRGPRLPTRAPPPTRRCSRRSQRRRASASAACAASPPRRPGHAR